MLCGVPHLAGPWPDGLAGPRHRGLCRQAGSCLPCRREAVLRSPEGCGMSRPACPWLRAPASWWRQPEAPPVSTRVRVPGQPPVGQPRAPDGSGDYLCRKCTRASLRRPLPPLQLGRRFAANGPSRSSRRARPLLGGVYRTVLERSSAQTSRACHPVCCTPLTAAAHWLPLGKKIVRDRKLAEGPLTLSALNCMYADSAAVYRPDRGK